LKSFSPSNILAQYAHRLQIAAPKEYDEFCQVFDAYATEVTVAVTSADQSEILNAQGRAQAFLHLLKLLRHPAGHSAPPTAQGQP